MRDLAVAVMLATLVASPAMAQEEADGTATRPDGWALTVAPYLWAAGLEGDVTLGGVDADVDQDFDDILDDLVFGAMMLVDARNDRFGVAVNGFYVRTDADSEVGPLDIDATTDSAALQAAAYYRVLELGPGHGEGVTLGIEPYAGARLTYVRAELQGDLELDALGVGIDREADRSETWVDPIVGSRAVLDLTDRWSLRLAGDVGGFGAGSDFTWAAQGLLDYRLPLGRFDTVLGVGYQALSWDYDDGDFEWDVTQQGPVIGAAIRF